MHPWIPDGLIAEGIVTTQSDDGTTNIAPMGPIVDPSWRRFVLRPFRTSTTYRNLKARGEGVFHVTDDVELIARAAVNRIETPPALQPAEAVAAAALADACRRYEFRVTALDDREERTEIRVETVASSRGRDFFGFNRAKHAVLEAAILATRIGILPDAEIAAELERLARPVERTAGPAERRAFDFLGDYIRERLG